MIPSDKPKARKKTNMTKKDTIDLSNDKSHEAEKEEETIFTEGTLQAPEIDDIENFKKSMNYGKQVVIPILRLLEESKAEVEEEVGRRMSLVEITSHFSKGKWNEEKQKLRMEAQKAMWGKLQAKDEVARVKLQCDVLQSKLWTKDETLRSATEEFTAKIQEKKKKYEPIF
ncbi:hypothetical protein R1flu_006747 [Riccia fluitans]|uniref:Uncharacterized protein n=1 Tax=Riccia fluitans TaxID=41844 RepID=A0ABD1YWW2_9MARC